MAAEEQNVLFFSRLVNSLGNRPGISDIYLNFHSKVKYMAYYMFNLQNVI